MRAGGGGGDIHVEVVGGGGTSMWRWWGGGGRLDGWPRGGGAQMHSPRPQALLRAGGAVGHTKPKGQHGALQKHVETGQSSWGRSCCCCCWLTSQAWGRG